MNHYTADRALFASNALVYLAIAFGTLSFWSDALSAGPIETHLVDYLVAALLTVAMLSVSFLLSGVVIRFAEAKEKSAPVTQAFVCIMGAVLILIEAGMTHMGLDWLDSRRDLGPGYVLIVASFGLSAFNVFSLYTFAREIPKVKAPVFQSRADGKADNIVFFGSDPQERKTLEAVVSKMKAGGML